jgi:hypothetical protein
MLTWKIIFSIIMIYHYLQIQNDIEKLINKHYNRKKAGEITIYKSPKICKKSSLNINAETINYKEIKKK